MADKYDEIAHNNFKKYSEMLPLVYKDGALKYEEETWELFEVQT